MVVFLGDRDDPRSTISSENVSFSIFTTMFINMCDEQYLIEILINEKLYYCHV